MKLKKWALIAEVISGAAVVVTLVFLVVGIRENTSTTRAVAYANLIDSINELESQRLNNSELTANWRLFRTGQLSNIELDNRGQLALYVQMLARNYEKAYYSNLYGIIGADEWERFERSICILYADTQAVGFGTFSPDFRAISASFGEYVRQSCGE